MTSLTYGGTQLSTLGHVSLLGDVWDIPQRRGANQIIPFEDGELHVNKFWSQRIITVGITMQESSMANVEANIDTLNTLISLRTEQVLAKTLQDTSVRNINATVNKPLQLAWFGPYVVKVVIEFTCAYPLWRSSVLSDGAETIDESPHAYVVANSGSVQERQPKIVLTGPLLNTVITNSTTGTVLTYTGTIAAPRVVTIQKTSGQWTVTDDLANNLINNVTHTGDASLFTLNPGNNSISVTDGTATTGTVDMQFYPPYL